MKSVMLGKTIIMNILALFHLSVLMTGYIVQETMILWLYVSLVILHQIYNAITTSTAVIK